MEGVAVLRAKIEVKKILGKRTVRVQLYYPMTYMPIFVRACKFTMLIIFTLLTLSSEKNLPYSLWRYR